jgi:hypothetical protein
MRDAQVEQRASITLDFDTTIVKFFGALNVTLL